MQIYFVKMFFHYSILIIRKLHVQKKIENNSLRIDHKKIKIQITHFRNTQHQVSYSNIFDLISYLLQTIPISIALLRMQLAAPTLTNICKIARGVFVVDYNEQYRGQIYENYFKDERQLIFYTNFANRILNIL